ncbi:FAD-dependent oxidoreductase [Imperialibacter roseus]|uniref:FAD-dependent oxidoreductase n=1 Tax=Imperialibacter roseus TaxID=1324217 RepID=A0ABZ0ISY2_9BACT|nr:FAD-dependent oxidoreductase [Imperialibacter roseus]WOK08130.1 FAD-dependent oxidoreductase [Imperialibacter roseus]
MSLSFWERQSFQNWDYIVVGGGIVGLSTAISLKEKAPGADILLLERGLLPSGASTKNAGFACFGSLTELVEDIKILGEEGCLALVKRRWAGLQKLRQRVGDAGLGFQQNGGYELVSEGEVKYLPEIPGVNTLLKSFFGIDVFQEDVQLVQKFGFHKSVVKTVIANPLEGQLHTGSMMRNLYQIAAAKKIHVLTGCEVKQHEDLQSHVEVSAFSPGTNTDITFKAKKLAFCTNAFASQYFPEFDIKPGRGLVFVTEPMKQVPFQGTFHMDQGFYYFRNAGDRILLGGGRNLDFDKETTTDFGVNEVILAELKRLLAEVIAPGSSLKIDQQWSGIMAFGKTKEPIVKKVSDNITIGVRLGGMGVAIGTLVGEELAALAGS